MAISIRASAPRLQKMVEEEADDAEAVTKLLELNETIKADLEKYDRLRKGDFQGAQQVSIKPMYQNSRDSAYIRTSPKKASNGAPTSLIDFDGELGDSQISTSSKESNSTGNPLEDLAGLSFNSSPSLFGQGGSISLGQDTSNSFCIYVLTQAC